jgi:hypothetical protein
MTTVVIPAQEFYLNSGCSGDFVVAVAAQTVLGGDRSGRYRGRRIHPAILSEAGLGPALEELARRSAVPVELDLNLGPRLSEQVEAAAYYIASEALANAAGTHRPQLSTYGRTAVTAP